LVTFTTNWVCRCAPGPPVGPKRAEGGGECPRDQSQLSLRCSLGGRAGVLPGCSRGGRAGVLITPLLCRGLWGRQGGSCMSCRPWQRRPPPAQPGANPAPRLAAADSGGLHCQPPHERRAAGAGGADAGSGAAAGGAGRPREPGRPGQSAKEAEGGRQGAVHLWGAGAGGGGALGGCQGRGGGAGLGGHGGHMKAVGGRGGHICGCQRVGTRAKASDGWLDVV
jgi:hypothetical protein